MQNSSYFIFLFYKYSWFENPAICLDKRILAHILGIKFFKIKDLYKNITKNKKIYYRMTLTK